MNEGSLVLNKTSVRMQLDISVSFSGTVTSTCDVIAAGTLARLEK